MKFGVGSKVEVLRKKKSPLGAWRSAEIVSCSGDEYAIRYERYSGISKGIVGKVKINDVRPCPPHVKNADSWEVGDIVEVFDDSYWKAAVIEARKGEGIHVRLIGSFDEFDVKIASVRVRQAWEGNKWVVLQKDSNCCEDLMFKKGHTLTSFASPAMHDEVDVQEACLSHRAPKRSSPNYCVDSEACFERPQKRIAVEEDNLICLEDINCSSSFIKKVDTSVYVQDSWSQSNCHESHYGRNIAVHKPNKQNSCEFLYSTVSSEASCSSVNRSGSHGDSDDSDALSSNADSYCHIRRKKYVHKKYVRRSQLDTYRSTLETLYSFGPLSWELEIYLTDLRIELCISNDEHLEEGEISRHTWLASNDAPRVLPHPLIL